MAWNPHLPAADPWSTQLGLFPVPLYPQSIQQRRFVLLNGARGSFCLDLGGCEVEDDARNLAWSCNVGHYVLVGVDHVEVQRWDQRRASVERYTWKTVRENLENFHRYLEMAAPGPDLSVISHAIRVFRKLRAVVGDELHGFAPLKAYLCLLACATDRTERAKLAVEDWLLDEAAVQAARRVSDSNWSALTAELLEGRPIEGLVPHLDLVLRHASGQLFQEAHYEAVFLRPGQPMLDGFLPSPVKLSKRRKATGIYYTPPALVRTVVQESLAALDSLGPSAVVLDPACGSGEFLREALRQLRLSGYDGHITLLGWDLSEAACDMARFGLGWELRGQRGHATVRIEHADSLAPSREWPQGPDIVLMNPPYQSWLDMSGVQREVTAGFLGELGTHRPDLSHAFLLGAASCVRDGGVVGAVLPASLLDAESAERLRGRVANVLSPRLIARLGSHMLFPGALVDAALYVGKRVAGAGEGTMAVWADHRTSSSAAALRALRRGHYLDRRGSYPVQREGFSIYRHPTLGTTTESWAPRPYRSWNLLHALEHMPRVGDLFNVTQGVLTGCNAAFLLDKRAWLDLPAGERAYFRPAVVNSSIEAGFLADRTYLFYPYGDLTIVDEGQLRQVLPQFHERYLLPNRDALLRRAGISAHSWWQLVRHRPWQIGRTPKLVSTYFGDAGSFAFDGGGDFVVVQGFSWLPRRAAKLGPSRRKVALAYLAILNSSLFSELLSAASNHVGGGQWNLSKRFVDKIALPDLFSADARPAVVADLCRMGNLIHDGQPINQADLDQLATAVYGLEGGL